MNITIGSFEKQLQWGFKFWTLFDKVIWIPYLLVCIQFMTWKLGQSIFRHVLTIQIMNYPKELNDWDKVLSQLGNKQLILLTPVVPILSQYYQKISDFFSTWKSYIYVDYAVIHNFFIYKTIWSCKWLQKVCS